MKLIYIFNKKKTIEKNILYRKKIDAVNNVFPNQYFFTKRNEVVFTREIQFWKLTGNEKMFIF